METPENELVDPRGVLNLDLVLLSEGRERLAGVAGVIGVMGDEGERDRGLPESTLAVSDLAGSWADSGGITGTKVRCCWRSGWTGACESERATRTVAKRCTYHYYDSK